MSRRSHRSFDQSCSRAPAEGVLLPRDRARVVPRCRAVAARKSEAGGEPSATARQRSLTWAQRLKRVFAVDIDKSAGWPIYTAVGRGKAVGHRDVPDETCRRCGGRLRVIASIEEPAVIERILEHLGRAGESVDPAHPSRGPPEQDRLL